MINGSMRGIAVMEMFGALPRLPRETAEAGLQTLRHLWLLRTLDWHARQQVGPRRFRTRNPLVRPQEAPTGIRRGADRPPVNARSTRGERH